tara:strand:+ start:1214 stop:1885 length:672 start_codon:yes stop_codon:yes gene_type:complete
VSDVLEQLAAPFPKSTESSLKKGGTTLTYIPVSAVIARTNEVLGLDWSYRVISTEVVDGWIIAHVRVFTAHTERDGFGGQEIKHRRDGQILDMGHDYKGAVSDALKKALQAFGVGLYLATHDESLSSTFVKEKAAGAAADEQRPQDLRGDPAPAATADVGASLKALAKRGKDLGLSNADLRGVASQVLGRVIAKASDITLEEDIELVQQRLDDLEAQQAKEDK